MKHRIIPVLLLVSLILNAQSNIAFLDVPIRPITTSERTIIAEKNQHFILYKNLCLIPASVEEESGYLILDTGAPDLVLNKVPEQALLEGGTCNGEVVVGSSAVEKLEFADQKRYNVEAYTLDMGHLEGEDNYRILGLLGYEQLKEFEILVDYSRKQIHFLSARKNSLHRSSKPKMVIDYQMQDHLPILSLTHNGKTYRFGLDTGAASNLISPELSGIINAIDTELTELRGLDGSIERVDKKKIAAFSIDGQALPTMHYLVQDLSHLYENEEQKIDGLLGAQFLKKWTSSINFEAQKIYIWQTIF